MKLTVRESFQASTKTVQSLSFLAGMKIELNLTYGGISRNQCPADGVLTAL
jgi:hypothetical protein